MGFTAVNENFLATKVLKALKCTALVNNFLQNGSSFVLIKKISLYETQKLCTVTL